ncbi:MAG: hypothetical protein AAF757_02440 [Cyanobacteria bacterium P01_D01_bin.116]
MIRRVNLTAKSRSGHKTIESLLQLLAVVELFNLGGIILGSGSNPDPKDLKMRLCFEISGIDPLVSEEQAEQVLHKIGEGLKEFDTTLTLEYLITSDNSINTDLQSRIDNPQEPESLYLDLGTQAIIKNLGATNKRKNVRILAFVTINPKTSEEEAGFLDKAINYFISPLNGLWTNRVIDTDKERERKLKIQLKKFHRAGVRYQQLLKQMSLNPRPLKALEIWEVLSRKFNTNCPLPSFLVLDEQGLREEKVQTTSYPKPTTQAPGDELHPVSLLAPNIKAGRSGLWVNDEYICILVLEGKPAGFFGDKDQLFYFSKIFNREEITGVEIITELTPISSKAVVAAQQFVTRKHILHQKTAGKHSTIDAKAELGAIESVATQQDLLRGKKPYRGGVVVVIRGKHPETVEETAYLIQNLLPPPARFVREREYATRLWLQSTGLTTQKLLAKPFERRSIYLSNEVAGVCCLAKTPEIHKSGVELISNYTNTPSYLNPLYSGHMAVFGSTGSGKSVLDTAIMKYYLSQSIPVKTIDLPNRNGIGTYTDFTLFHGGVNVDITTSCNNLFELPNLAQITEPSEQKRRLITFKKEINRILLLLILGSDYELNQLNRTVTALIPRISRAFWNNSLIQKRIKQAQDEGLGSAEWSNYPVLSDWLDFCDTSKLKLGFKYPELEQALDFIRLQISSWIDSPIGDCINQPSSFDTDNPFTTFSLTNLEDEEEAEVWAALIFNAISRQAAKCLYCLIHIDEASVFLKYPSFARLLSRKFATSRKSGELIMITTQDVDSIVDTGVYGQMILQNLRTKLIGKTQKSATKSFVKHLGIPPDLIKQNETFENDFASGCSNWLLDCDGTYIQGKYYPSYPLLALTANNPNEVAARNKFKSQHPNKFEWLTKFWRYYRKKMQNNNFNN